MVVGFGVSGGSALNPNGPAARQLLSKSSLFPPSLVSPLLPALPISWNDEVPNPLQLHHSTSPSPSFLIARLLRRQAGGRQTVLHADGGVERWRTRGGLLSSRSQKKGEAGNTGSKRRRGRLDPTFFPAARLTPICHHAKKTEDRASIPPPP